MKNITLSADERLIEAARARARDQRTTLNDEFRKWLAEYVGQRERAERAIATLRELQGHYSTGGKRFTRDELNERR
jgi:hypothetical protein